jgi:hypothetical protein
MTEIRALLGGLIKDHYTATPTPNVVWDDSRYEPMDVSPLIKVYPISSPAQPKGLGYTHRRVSNRLTIDIRCRNQANAVTALAEVIRLLGVYRIRPFTGYDLMDYDDGTFRGGSTWLYQWLIEVEILQNRKPV